MSLGPKPLVRVLFGVLALHVPAFVQSPEASLERQYAQSVRPLINKYCLGCHTGASAAAQFDLRAYPNLASVIQDHTRWALVIEKLEAKEMPPPNMPQPSAGDRKLLIDWVEAVRTNEARKNAGDPGMVLARRLSNAEYNYTIRDLTGVDLRPAREFPIDPANTEGFDNSGESLAMTPSLLSKYLQAARQVADNMVLTPDGINFAPHPMLVETDREKYAIQRIVDFYRRQPTDYAEYFLAAWRHKHRAALGKPNLSLEGAAREAKVSPKYLPLVWKILGEAPGSPKNEVGPIARLQSMWRALPAPAANRPEPRELMAEMRDYVAHIRHNTAMQFAAPVVRGIPEGSQPLLNWKYIKFNTNRRKFDATALRNDSDPRPALPEIPKFPGLHRESAPRWAAVMAHVRAADPDLVVPAAERSRYEESFARFADVFPDRFYVSERGRYFPDNSEDKGRFLSAGYHNVMGYWRDDNPLMELILDENGTKELEKLWDEFDYIGDHTNRTWHQYYFNQAGEVDGRGAESGRARPLDKAVNDTAVIFELRDAYMAKAAANSTDPEAVEAMRHHFHWVNDTLRRIERLRRESEPQHLQALLRFAERAYRRPLSGAERDGILSFYKSLRANSGLTHEEAIRDSIVSVLMAPEFCYRLDLRLTRGPGSVPAKPTPGAKPPKALPLSAFGLANRLSYFLWSSMPDEELLRHAASGDLNKPEVLAAQARRMLKNERARGLATEFFGNWLGFRRFEQHNSVDRTRFPVFDDDLRQAMFEEPVRFVEDIIRRDRPVLELIYGDYTFVNPVLAKHYGMPAPDGGDDIWARVEGASKFGRGALLPMSVFLTVNSPGLRTSPVKRGYWVVRNVLGEVIPPPPPSVPELPEDEAKIELPLRDMLAKHRENALCAGCHARFDSFGLAFEGYGPIGERRAQDLGGRAVDAKAVFPGGSQGDGFEGLRNYIRSSRQKDFVENISRKLLAYALSRSLMLSDEPALHRMESSLAASGFRFSSLVESIITSPQFLNRRNPAYEEKKGE